MTTLRLIVLIFGIFVIAGVWWWSRRQQRARAIIPSRGVERLQQAPGLEAPRVYTDDEDADVDFNATLADLSGLMRESRADGAAPAEQKDGTRRRTLPQRHPQQIDMGFTEESQPGTLAQPVLPQRVLALYVCAPQGAVFTGTDIAQAFATVGMRYGAMSIYHHHGVGKQQSSEPLFSAANMFEPGTFDPAERSRFTTGGLALFMQLPTRGEASLIFELMRNTAQRLAECLHGEVLDDTRQPLGSQSLEQLRALVKQYD